MDAGRRVRLGAIWLGDGVARKGVARRRRPYSRLELRGVEQNVTRPNAPGTDNNLLASWSLSGPGKQGPAINIPQPAGGGDRNALPLYDFPNQRIVNHLITAMPIRVSALRTLGAYTNVFALESFMDELAAAAGQD